MQHHHRPLSSGHYHFWHKSTQKQNKPTNKKTYMWLLTLKVHLYVHGQFKCSEGAGRMKYWIWTCAKEQGMRHLLKGAASQAKQAIIVLEL